MPEFDVNIATCRHLPEPDPDLEPLVEALARAGLKARVVVWNDESVDWSEGRLTLIRSTWDYYLDRWGFVKWAERVDAVSRLHNPPAVVRWNSHKGYLLQLPLSGVPIVPTVLAEAKSQLSLAELCDHEGWRRIVVKPAVSAGSYETYAMERDDLDQACFDRLVGKGDVLVQPYMESVDDYGERSLIFIDGELTHCVQKAPRFAGQEEAITGPLVASDEERAVGEAALSVVGRTLLYGRVDLVRGEDGPLLAELEVIEPSLFFRFSEYALERFVASLALLSR